MITPEQLSRYDAYFVRFNIGILYISALGDNRIEANFTGHRRIYAIDMLKGAILQNLHPLSLPHILIDLSQKGQ